MTYSIIIQLIVSGLALGFIYALVAIEYTLIFNSTGLLNFSHDKFIMLGAYIFAAQFLMRMGTNPLLLWVRCFWEGFSMNWPELSGVPPLLQFPVF